MYLSPSEYLKKATKEHKLAMCPPVGKNKGFRMKISSELSLNHTFTFPN